MLLLKNSLGTKTNLRTNRAIPSSQKRGRKTGDVLVYFTKVLEEDPYPFFLFKYNSNMVILYPLYYVQGQVINQ